MTLSLPQEPPQYFIDEFLLPNWDKSNTAGYGPNLNGLATATTIDDVGAYYPSLIVTFSNETSGGETSYDYLSTATQNPGQVRDGTLIATARAEDGEEGHNDQIYTNDQSISAVSADRLTTLIRQEVERICTENAVDNGTQFATVGCSRTGDVPDDDERDPTVRIEDTTVVYSWFSD